MVRPVTTRERLAMFLAQWARWADGYVQLTVYPGVGNYCDADIYCYPEREHTYFGGSLDQVLYEVDEFLRTRHEQAIHN